MSRDNEPLSDDIAYSMLFYIQKGETPDHEWLVKLAKWTEDKLEQLDKLQRAAAEMGRAA